MTQGRTLKDDEKDEMIRELAMRLREAERIILSRQCEECGYTFSPNELLAEDATAWGHPCHQPNLIPGTPCESHRKFLRCVDPQTNSLDPLLASSSQTVEEATRRVLERMAGFKFPASHVLDRTYVNDLIAAVRAAPLVSSSGLQEEEKDHGAGLIGQTIPDVAETEPRPIWTRVRDAACFAVWRATDVNLSRGHERLIQAAAREAFLIAKERFSGWDPCDVRSKIDRLLLELTDGNQASTQSSGSAQSAAQK